MQTGKVGLQYGELVLSIGVNSGKRSLIKLREGGFMRDRGILHSDLVSKNKATVQTKGILFRRVTLEEYVVLMNRVAAPAYPKDAQTMINMLGLGEGSRVLEAGTGSGGLTLHLSKEVGTTGQVYSFENNPRHMQNGMMNYDEWRANWALSHGLSWPDNVRFTEACLSTVNQHVKSPVDAVALDMMSPGPLFIDFLPILKPGGLVSVYFPNITQYIMLLDHLHSNDLPFHLERVIEVTHKEWTVKPAASKHHRLAEMAKDSVQKYICRPSHHQQPHTAFLGLLRKLDCNVD